MVELSVAYDGGVLLLLQSSVTTVKCYYSQVSIAWSDYDAWLNCLLLMTAVCYCYYSQVLLQSSVTTVK